MNPRIKNFVSSRVSCQLSNVKGSLPRSSASSPRQSASSLGFTLLELLIVVSIIAILSVALVLVLDPAETLKKSRDSQRMSDLATMKTALALYVTSTTTPYLGGVSANTTCKNTPTATWTTSDKIYYSYNGTDFADTGTLDGATSLVTSTSTANPSVTDGTGWIPVNFDSLIGGSPISNIPLDPVNTIASLTNVVSTDLVYRYACSEAPLAFEINAKLESDTYTTGSDNKHTKDGGNNSNLYEIGTNLKILGSGTDL